MDTEGKPYYMMLSITPVHDTSGKICNWAVHLRDITAQKEAEQPRSRPQLIDIADQIKNPLDSLKEIVESIKSNKGGSDVDWEQKLDRMTEELNRIQSLVNDVQCD